MQTNPAHGVRPDISRQISLEAWDFDHTSVGSLTSPERPSLSATCDTLRRLKCSLILGVTFIEGPNFQMHEIPTVVKLKPKEGFTVGGA